jgi:hypothetical protein
MTPNPQARLNAPLDLLRSSRSRAKACRRHFNLETWIQSVRNLSVVLAAVAMLNACGKSIDVAEWTEEVKLHDGQMVQVWRKARAYSGGFPNSKRGRNIDFEFKYVPMNVHWKGDWSRTPVSFDIFDGVPHLVLNISDKASCTDRPQTDFHAQFLRWTNGQWVDIAQMDFPVDKALMNLSSDYWGHSTADDYKGRILWDNKRLPGGFNQARPDTIKIYYERGSRFCSVFFVN